MNDASKQLLEQRPGCSGAEGGLGFEDDPSAPGRRVWRPSGRRAVGSGLVAIVLGLLTLFQLVVCVWFAGMPGGLPESLFLLIFPGLMAALTAYVWRDMRGKLGGLIVLDGSSLTLHLTGGRSLIHNPPPCHETIPFGVIEAVETRLEAYGAQTMGMMQRTYRLRRRSGPPIFLFEERALGTRLADHSLQVVAAEIAQRAGAPLNDLGMVQGRGGILGAWFTSAPDWSAAALPAPRQVALWHRVYLTGVLVTLTFAVIWIFR